MLDIDLNLLRVFESLYDLRSVTLAADRLSLTQSAVSHALGRLRRALDDPLFVRASGGLAPTPHAIAIAPGLRDGLARLREALSPSIFDPATATRTFTIRASAYFCALLVPTLVGAARTQAPNITIRIEPSSPDTVAALDGGDADLVLTLASERMPPRIASEYLFEDHPVWIAAIDNPVCRLPLDAASIRALPRLTIVAQGPFGTRISEMADAAAPAEPSPAAVAYDSMTAIAIVSETDLVALVPRLFAERSADKDRIAILDVPVTGRAMPLAMVWHRRAEADRGLAWLRGQVRAVAARS